MNDQTGKNISDKTKPNAKTPGTATQIELLWLTFLFAVFVFLSQVNYLLFHISIEIAVISMLFCIAAFTVQTSAIASGGFISLIGTSAFFIAIINAAHAYAYKGMGIFSETGADLPTKLWIALKFMDTLTMLAACLYIKSKLEVKKAAAVFAFITAALLAAIFIPGIFPSCYDDARGALTTFKIASEYFFMATLALCIYLVISKKSEFSAGVLRLIVFSLAFKIISGAMFTLYRDVHGLLNAGGHFFHLLSFYFVFKTVVETNLKTPYNAIFYDLTRANEILMEEIGERKAAEERLAASENKLRSLFDNMDSPMLFLEAARGGGSEIADAKIVAVNPAFENIFGLKKDEIAGKELSTAVSALVSEEFDLISILKLCFDENEGSRVEFYFSDYKKWFSIYVFRTTGDYAAAFFNDITYQKNTEDMLAESQRFFKSTFNSLSQAVAITDENGMIISANASWRALSGSNAFFGVRCGVGENYIQICALAAESGMTCAGELKKLALDVINGEALETSIELECLASSRLDDFHVTFKRFEGEGPVRILIIYENITARKKSEKLLERLNRTFLNLTSNFDRNIVLLTSVCGELFNATTLYNIISGGVIRTAASFAAPEGFKTKNNASGHICDDVVKNAAKNPAVCYIPHLNQTSYYESDPNVKLYGLKTYLGKPVFRNGKCIGTLCVVYDRDIENNPNNNKILEIIATAIGIEEERKLAGEKLAQMSRAIEQSASTIVITDSKGNIEYANPKFSVTTGYTLEEAVGNNPRILKSGEMTPEEYKKMWETISGGSDWHGEFHNRRKNGELYWEYATISPLRNTEGEITHYLAVKEDITERKMIEIELARAKAAAEAANQSKSEFLANMSHEIRTPMTSIMGMAELLLDTSLNESQKKYSQQIYESSTLLLTIINDILDLSKIEAGKMTLEKIDMNIRSIATSLADMMSVKALEKKLILNSRLDENIPEFVKGDPVRIRQILLNLLSNAIKFTGRGSVTLNISLKSSDDAAARVRFEVTDTGIGLSPEAMKNLFKPFAQADSSTTRKFGGTGLGLSISKRLVEMMRGEIGVESREGEGSTFWFEVPFEIGSRPATDLSQDASAAVRGNMSRVDPAATVILLADDNPANQRVLLLQLNKLGFKNVHVASDGREAVEMASGFNYSLILMDCQMNVMDGFEATKIIRAKETGMDYRTPIIALTADAMSGTRDKCIAAGMDDYITKPAGIQQLQSMLDKWLLRF